MKALAADGLIEGYPNGKFEGNRPMTRYEMAVLVNRAVDKLEANIAAGQKANAADIAALKKLVDEFGPEIKAIQDHLATLDKQVADVSAIAKANAATLKRQQFHLYSFIRAPGSYGELTSAYTAAGLGLPSGTKVTYGDALGSPGGVAGQNNSFSGQYTYGTAYMVNRFVFSGDVDANNSYAFRLENRYYMSTPNYGTGGAFTTGNAGSSPAYCTSLASCNPNADYPANTSFRLNYAYYTWHPPGGFYVQAGRLVQGDGGSDLGGQPMNLLYSDYFNGALLGYYGPPGGLLPTLRLEAGFGVGQPSSESPVTTVSQQQFWGQASFDFIPHHLNVGAAWITEIGNGVTLWDPSSHIISETTHAVIPGVSGLYCGISAAPTNGCPAFFGTNETFGSVFMTYRLSDYLHVNAEGVHHFGNDPFTGATYAQPNGFWGIVTLGNNAGPKGTPWAEAGYIGTGFNGESVEGGITSTTAYFPIFVGNPGGYYFYYGGLHYKVANNVDVGVFAMHGDLNNGTTMPASSQGCPGCYLTHDVKNAVYLQTVFSF